MLAIVISAVSASIALFALGWNIYRDVIAKPRLKAHVSVYDFRDQDGKIVRTAIMLRGTNWGPGEIVVEKTITCTKRFFRKASYGVVIPDVPGKQADVLPKRLKVSESVQQFFPYTKDAAEIMATSLIGFCDSLGRYHWATTESFKQLRAQWRKNFQ